MKLGVLFARCAVVAGAAALLVPAPASSAGISPRVHDLVRTMTVTHAMGLRAAAAAPIPSNITVADPGVSRPDTAPCTVTLFANDEFDNFNIMPFAYTPPGACPGPWAKVVLTFNLKVTPGVQYDRTATIGLGGSTIFFGTTAEPFSNEGPSWSTQSDVTDLSALFAAPHSGEVSLGNLVNSTYTGILYGTATLQFYPPDAKYPAPRVADIVVPLADSNGNPVALNTSASLLTTSFTPPTNVEQAYLDVMSQSQSGDEFWYTCFPNNLAGPLDNCGSTAFRETDASVDGTPAGVAPVYPWIYTGGIDPLLWAPTPGVQTLNFKPYRINLTPFAGTLDSGGTHSVGLSVFNADSYFAVTGNLLLFLDHGATKPLVGKVDVDNLAATPPETVGEVGNYNPNGWINTASKRFYQIIGHLYTSHGLVSTKINTSTNFVNTQQIVNSATQFQQNIRQNEVVEAQTSTTTSSGTSLEDLYYDYPLDAFINETVNANGTITIHTTIDQSYTKTQTNSEPNALPTWATSTNTVTPTDTLLLVPGNGGYSIGKYYNTASAQVYTSSDSTGSCYGHKVTSKSLVVTSNTAVPCPAP